MPASGAVDYPVYMKKAHEVLIGRVDHDWNEGASPGQLTPEFAPENRLPYVLEKALRFVSPYGREDDILTRSEVGFDTIQTKFGELSDSLESHDLEQDWDEVLGRSFAAINRVPLALPSTVVSQERGKALALDLITDVRTIIDTLQTDNTLWDALVTNIESAAGVVLRPAAVNGIVTNARIDAGLVINDALERAVSFINNSDGPIQALITTFTERHDTARNIAYGRIDGEAALSGTTNSSSRTFAKALVEQEYSRGARDYEAQIASQVLQQILSTFIGALDVAVRSSTSGALQDSTNRVQFFQTALDRRYSELNQFRAALVDTYLNSALGTMRTEVSAAVTEQGSRLTSQTQLLVDQTKQQMSLFDLQKNMLTSRADFSRVDYLMSVEDVTKKADLNAARGRYELELLHQASTIIGALQNQPFGGQRPLSTAASAIAGGLSGAAAGAFIGSTAPGIGTVAGAGIGFVLGAIGGLL